MQPPKNRLAMRSQRPMSTRDIARLSVRKNGKGLPGMVDWGTKSGISASAAVMQDLAMAMPQLGVIKLWVEGEKLKHKKLKFSRKDKWEKKLDKLQKFVDDLTPVGFALFRGDLDCLLVFYIPEKAKPSDKVKLNSTKGAIKDALIDVCSPKEILLEEFAVHAIEELNFKEYDRRQNVEKPLTEQELLRQEQDAAPTAGGYGFLAMLKAKQAEEGQGTDNSPTPFLLPGLGGNGKKVPEAVTRMSMRVGMDMNSLMAEEAAQMQLKKKSSRVSRVPQGRVRLPLANMNAISTKNLAKPKGEKINKLQAFLSTATAGNDDLFSPTLNESVKVDTVGLEDSDDELEDEPVEAPPMPKRVSDLSKVEGGQEDIVPETPKDEIEPVDMPLEDTPVEQSPKVESSKDSIVADAESPMLSPILKQESSLVVIVGEEETDSPAMKPPVVESKRTALFEKPVKEESQWAAEGSVAPVEDEDEKDHRLLMEVLKEEEPVKPKVKSVKLEVKKEETKLPPTPSKKTKTETEEEEDERELQELLNAAKEAGGNNKSADDLIDEAFGSDDEDEPVLRKSTTPKAPKAEAKKSPPRSLKSPMNTKTSASMSQNLSKFAKKPDNPLFRLETAASRNSLTDDEEEDDAVAPIPEDEQKKLQLQAAESTRFAKASKVIRKKVSGVPKARGFNFSKMRRMFGFKSKNKR